MTVRRLAAAGLLLISVHLPAVFGGEPPQPSSLAESFRQALRIDPENALLRYQLGVSLLREERLEEAVTEIGRAYPALAGLAEANYNLGLAHARLGDPDSALLYFEQAEALGAAGQPELYPLANAYYNLGLAYLETGQLAPARDLFERVLALAPERTDIHRLLGDLHARAGETDRALAAFDSYLQTFPDDETTREYVFALHFNRGLELLEGNRNEAAYQAFDQALGLLPDSPLALYHLAYLDFREGRIGPAVDRLQRALPNAPGDLHAGLRSLLHNCALAYLQQRKLQLAAAAAAPLVEQPAADPADLGLAGNIHLALGHFETAYTLFDRVLAVDRDNRQALQNRISAAAGALEERLARTRAHLESGNFPAAAAALEQAAAVQPGDPRIGTLRQQITAGREQKADSLFGAAERELAQGRPQAALEAVRRGLQLLPGAAAGIALEEAALQHLEEELRQRLRTAGEFLARSDFAAARQAYQDVLALDDDHPEAAAALVMIEQRQLQALQNLVTDGEAALEKGDLEAAGAAFHQALQLKPDHSPAREGKEKVEALRTGLAAEALQAGRQNAAAGRLEEARRNFQRSLEIHENRQVRQELAKVEEAIAAQQTGMLQAARAAHGKGQFRRARTLYAQLLAAHPGQAQAQREQAELDREMMATVGRRLEEGAGHLGRGEYAAAISAFRQALEIDPVHAAAQRGLEQSRARLQEEMTTLVARGVAGLEQGNLAEAEALLNQALEMDPYHAEARAARQRLEALRQTGLRAGDEDRLYLQGIEWYTKGRYQEAVASWEKVLILVPDHEKARMNIDKARRKMRQIREYDRG